MATRTLCACSRYSIGGYQGTEHVPGRGVVAVRHCAFTVGRNGGYQNTVCVQWIQEWRLPEHCAHVESYK